MVKSKNMMMRMLLVAIALLLTACGKIEADPLVDAQALVDGSLSGYVDKVAERVAAVGVAQDNIFGTVSQISNLGDEMFVNTAEVYTQPLAEKMREEMALTLGEAAVDQRAKTATVELRFTQMDALALAGAAQHFSKAYFTDRLWFYRFETTLEEHYGSRIDKVCASMVERLPAEAKQESTVEMTFQYDSEKEAWVCNNTDTVFDALFANLDGLTDAAAVQQSAEENFPCPYASLPMPIFSMVLPMDVLADMPDVTVSLDSSGLVYENLSYNGTTVSSGTVALQGASFISGEYDDAMNSSAQMYSLVADDLEEKSFTGQYLNGHLVGTPGYKIYDYFYDLSPVAETYAIDMLNPAYGYVSFMYKEDADYTVLDYCARQFHPFALYPEWYE